MFDKTYFIKAKELITSMLQAEPENRIKIGAIMENSWISVF